MRIAVVGGGISGLTAAYRLRTLLGDAAVITVFESTEMLGGKLRTIDLGGTRFDVGAEAFLARRPEALTLARELGLADQLVHPTGARATVRAGGSTVPLPSRTLMGLPADPDAVAQLLSESGRAAVAAERDLPPLHLPAGDVSLGGVLRDRFGDELVDRLVDPLLGGVYAGGADGLGLRAVLPTVAEQIDAGAGSLTAASAQLLPASAVDDPVFATLTGGLSTLVTGLAERARPELRLGAPVREIRPVRVGWLVDDLEFDAVVLAVPAPAARRLLDGVAPAASDAFAQVELASMAVVAFAFPAGTRLPDASGVLIAAGESHHDGTPFAAKAFTFSSRKWTHHGQAGVLVRGSVGRFGQQEALMARDDELIRLVRADLAGLTGITVDPAAAAVTRWGGGLPQYGVGHTDRVAEIERAVADLPGLEAAGATLHGVGIPACVATADAAARRLADHLLRAVTAVGR
ncbi:MAG: FAD-dependent oxidoreductase [Haloechinothrix sp.]